MCTIAQSNGRAISVWVCKILTSFSGICNAQLLTLWINNIYANNFHNGKNHLFICRHFRTPRGKYCIHAALPEIHTSTGYFGFSTANHENCTNCKIENNSTNASLRNTIVVNCRFAYERFNKIITMQWNFKPQRVDMISSTLM